ncbi:hypothetical protein BGZ95_008132, partial [Linnemannia exigua]
ISCLAEMDLSLPDEGQDEDMADDTSDIEGVDRAEDDETASSGEDVAGLDSSVEDTCDEQSEVYPTSQSVKEEQGRASASLQRNVLNAIRDSLFDDPYIIETAETYGFPEGKRITMNEKNGDRYVTFYIKAVFFDDWLKRHSECIGTTFTQRTAPKPYSTNIKETSSQAKKDRAGQIAYRYSCHCKSKKYKDKNRVKGGKTG